MLSFQSAVQSNIFTTRIIYNVSKFNAQYMILINLVICQESQTISNIGDY